MKQIFEGVCSALVTPFKDGKVDFESLKNLIEFQIENGIKAISVLGTTGEPCALDENEKTQIIKFCSQQIAGRVKYIVGVGSNNFDKVIKQGKVAKQYGADALLIVTPYYNKCTQNGIVNFYDQISKALQFPMIVYNVPSRTGVNILPKTFEKLAKIPYVVGFKQASSNIDENMLLLQKCKHKVAIYSGEDSLNYVFYCLGAKGAISVVANAFPKQTNCVYENVAKHNYAKALDAQERLTKITKLLFCEVNPIPIKACLSMMGLCKNELRLPLTLMQNTKKLEKEVKKLTKKG